MIILALTTVGFPGVYVCELDATRELHEYS